MARWKDSICLLTSADPANRGFGTGFVFHRDSTGRRFLLTCLHVVETLQRPRRDGDDHPPDVLADGRIAEVWLRGDRALDLAVLAVDGLALPPLGLGAPSARGRRVETAGYAEHEPEQQTVVSRPLSGRVRDNNAVKSLRHPGGIAAWSLDIEIEADLFRELKDGYSGSPVLDPETGEAVGVMNLKWSGAKGHAVCVGSLRLLLAREDAPPIPDYLPPTATAAARSRPPGAARGSAALACALEWLASTLDHEGPLGCVEDAFADSPAGVAPGPRIFTVEAGLADCPRALAEHLALHLGSLASCLAGHDDPVVEIWPVRFDAGGLRKALLDRLPPPDEPDRDAQDETERLRHWLGPGLDPDSPRVIYCELSVPELGARIPAFVAETARLFAQLAGPDPRAPVIVLLARVLPESRSWSWLARWRPWRRGHQGGCVGLGRLERISLGQVQRWLRALAARTFPGGRSLHRNALERLESDLSPLFPDDRARLPYVALRAKARATLRDATLTEPTRGDRG